MLFHKGLDFTRKTKDLKRSGIFLKSIGVAYLKLDDYKAAEKYLREALAIGEQLKNDLQIMNACISLGNALKEQSDFKNATLYYERSLAIALKLNNEKLIAGNYNNLGNVMRRLKDNKQALAYFKKALEMNIQSGNKLWESFNYHNISNVYKDLKQYDQAYKYVKLSNDLKVELGDSLSLVSGYLLQSEISAIRKDYKNAYECLNLHVKISDSLNLREQRNLLKDLEAKYESDKKQFEITQLKTDNELQSVKNNSLKMEAGKNRNIILLASIALVSLIIGLLLLVLNLKKRRQTNELLNTKNNEIEETNKSLNEAHNELSIKNKEVIDSINYATYIQQASLPNISQISTDQLHFELFFAPKDIVSGDFYFSYQLYQKSVFGIADCTGHGVPGAMVSLVGMNSLDKVVREEKHASSNLMIDSFNAIVKNSLNRGTETINDGMDISFCYLTHEDNVLHFTGANHTALIIRENAQLDLANEDPRIALRLTNDTHSLIQMPGARRPIGKSISQDPFYEVQLKMRKNDRIVLVTDGYADQSGGQFKKKLMKGTLLRLLLESTNLSVKDQLAFMRNQFDAWKGKDEQVDDVCLLIIEVLKD